MSHIKRVHDKSARDIKIKSFCCDQCSFKSLSSPTPSCSSSNQLRILWWMTHGAFLEAAIEVAVFWARVDGERARAPKSQQRERKDARPEEKAAALARPYKRTTVKWSRPPPVSRSNHLPPPWSYWLPTWLPRMDSVPPIPFQETRLCLAFVAKDIRTLHTATHTHDDARGSELDWGRSGAAFATISGVSLDPLL